jgi:hypothetical protein
MILSISKKVMLIYNLISKIFILLLINSSFASDDFDSFCFESNVSLVNVKQSINFILTDKDTLTLREEDHCLDIVISETRKNVLEKYLVKHYALISTAPKTPENCHIELKTINKQKINTQDFKLGQKNNLVASESTSKAVTTSELLLGAGKIGRLAVGNQNLQVDCRPAGDTAFELQFYFEEKSKATVSTSLRVSKNETVNLANVTKELNEKNRTLGIPQTAIGNTEGIEENTYELKVN